MRTSLNVRGVRAKIDRKAFEKLRAQINRLTVQELANLMRGEAGAELCECLTRAFSRLAVHGPSEDPTALEHWVDVFRNHCMASLRDGIFTTTGGTRVQLIDKAFLGYDTDAGATDQEPIHWAVYYIEGLMGDYVFITPEMYGRFRGRPPRPEWQRFNRGFMISKEAYLEEGWDRVFGPPDLHPFSVSRMEPRSDLFKEALYEFDADKWIKVALQKVNDRLRREGLKASVKFGG